MDGAKRAAGRAAAELVEDGMVLGLGTGSTSAFAIERLGERVRQGLRVRGVPTSLAAAQLARASGVPLVTFDDVDGIDLTIDGADEVDPAGNLIKGGGGALLREKVVAQQSRRVVIVVDRSKLVPVLGVAFRLPVEVVSFALRPVSREMEKLGGSIVVRGGASRYLTDNGNPIIDVAFPEGIPDAAAFERELDAIPGVVESGLFVGLADVLYIGNPAGIETRSLRTARHAGA